MIENKVWNILDKEIWAGKGQLEIEQLHDAINRIFEKVGKDDMRIFYKGMCTKLFPTMDILDEYLREV